MSGVVALAFLGRGGLPAVAEQEPLLRPTNLEEQLVSVSSQDGRTRRLAASRLQTEYDVVARRLAERLRDARESGELDRSWEGRTHLGLLIIGRWRAQECIGELARLLTFHLDRKTVPAGAKYPPSALYPAATALAAIGDGAVTKAVLGGLRTAENDEAIAVATWVLWKIHGEDLARVILRNAIENSQAGREKANLGKSLDLVGRGESLLSF